MYEESLAIQFPVILSVHEDSPYICRTQTHASPHTLHMYTQTHPHTQAINATVTFNQL